MRNSVLLALVFALCFSCSFGEEEVKDERFAVDMKIDDNQHVKFPYYDQSIKTMDQDLKDLLIRQRIEMIAYMTKAVENELRKPGSTGFYGWMMVGKKLLSINQKQKKERNNLGKTYPLKRQYNKEMDQLILEIINESKARSEELKGQSRSELIDKLLAYSHALQEAFRHSPVGPYVKLSEGFINGQEFTKLTLDIVASLRNHGFANHIKLVSTLL